MQVLSERGGWPMSHRFLALSTAATSARSGWYVMNSTFLMSSLQRGTVLVIGRHPLRDAAGNTAPAPTAPVPFADEHGRMLGRRRAMGAGVLHGVEAGTGNVGIVTSEYVTALGRPTSRRIC